MSITIRHHRGRWFQRQFLRCKMQRHYSLSHSAAWRALKSLVPLILLAACGGGNGGEPPATASGLASNGAIETTPALAPATEESTGSRGFANERVQAATLALGAASTHGAFRIVCDFSHMAPDDPIVFAGQPGRSHLHAFFGNTAVNAYSTSQSIAQSGNSSCHGGTANRSAYWVPAVIDGRTGAPVRPAASMFYYKPGYDGVPAASIQPLPAGLRMIAGDPANSVRPSNRVRFSCHQNSNLVGSSLVNCPVGDDLVLSIEFPQCWDGVNLDSPDHKSHMSYAHNGCPATHPVALPLITFNIHVPVTEPNQVTHWRLSSDSYSGPAGYSMHADWWNGWKPAIMDTWIQHCIHEGWDCRANLLGNGTTLF